LAVIFSSRVDRWRPLVEDLAGDLPVDLVLGIVWHESAGRAGAIGRIKTRCAKVPTSAGGERKSCHALGLMQVVPGNVKNWNARHPDRPATYEDMTGSSAAAAKIQLRLGIAILRSSFAWLNRYGFAWPGAPLSHEQVKIGLMVYAWGQGNIKPYLDELVILGRPITALEISTRWPALGEPQNHPLRYSRVVYNKVYGAGAGAGKQHKKRRGESFAAPLAIAALLWWSARGRAKNVG
jgi:hypothetical protein